MHVFVEFFGFLVLFDVSASMVGYNMIGFFREKSVTKKQ